jgi:hypothetical protein
VGALHAYLAAVPILWSDGNVWGAVFVTGAFCAYGLVFVLWHGAAQVVQRVRDSMRALQVPSWMRVGLAWLAFTHVRYAMAWLFIATEAALSVRP